MTIADFKSGLATRRSRREVSESLVGATLRHIGGQTRDQYTYNDGRTCAHPDGPYHSCAYVEARNRLIPAAEAEARGAAPLDQPIRFARAFMGAMDRLWTERKA